MRKWLRWISNIKRQNDINECRNNLMRAVSKARANSDVANEAVALGMLAFNLYFNSNPDVTLAEEYAHRAEALGECNYSKSVLDDITVKKIMQKNMPIYNEAKKEEAYGDLQHLWKALKLYERLDNWGDASDRAAVCRVRIDEENRRHREEMKQREMEFQHQREERKRREAELRTQLRVQKKEEEETITLKIAVSIVIAIVVIFILIIS